MENESILGCYRILDLTDDRGYLAGRLLADLGADVIKVEKLGGDPGRLTGPFYRDVPHPEKSIFWFAFNAGKKSITLNLQSADGREIFKTLIKTCDVVIESFPPGYMSELGLSYKELEEVNPRIVLTSITGFGQSGPYQAYEASDLIVTALSGYMSLCGDADRPPVRITFPQAYLHAAGEAAAATVVALLHRGITNEGQHVDVSAQQSLSIAMMDAYQAWDLLKIGLQRTGYFRARPGTKFIVPLHFQCQDGYVYFQLFGGTVGARGNQELVNWMGIEGAATEFLRSIDWTKFDPSSQEIDQAYMDGIIKPAAKFFSSHTKKELIEEGTKRHIMICSVSTIKDIVENAQLAARNYWVDIKHSELGDAIKYPGAFAKLNRTSCGIRCRAPLIGEHNEQIYLKELAFSKAKLVSLRQTGVI